MTASGSLQFAELLYREAAVTTCPGVSFGLGSKGDVRVVKNEQRIREAIRGIFEESEQTYGSPRVFKELKLGRGMAIGEKRVA